VHEFTKRLLARYRAEGIALGTPLRELRGSVGAWERGSGKTES
jgi:hypothetical protein